MALIESTEKFSVTRTAPVHRTKFSGPAKYADASACELSIQVGIFFDGTGNNLYLDQDKKGHSNVARLYDTYLDSPQRGSYRIYLPGVGTPFPLIGEDTESTLGSAFGSGGDSRILFALLRVFDAVHQTLFHTEMFGMELRKALCSHSASKADKRQLQKVGLASSLVDSDARNSSRRYLSICADSIREKMRAQQTPKVCECLLDVFGFSRGATEARVFCHWLNDLLGSSGLAGIPLRFRFLGLLDTVASVGIWEGVKNDQLRLTGGHSNWATPEVMRILPNVESCIHLIAMHELRKNFPLDTVLVNHSLPSNCAEFVYPGSHSDVGGGYRPGELGVLAGDSLKLSQIPLNHMYDCAVAAGVPLAKELLQAKNKAAFTVNDELLAAFKQFVDVSTDAPRSLADWALPYLVWRWQTRKAYEKTGQVMKSSPEERSFLMASNQQFCWDEEQMQIYAYSKTAKWPKRPYDRDRTQVTLPLLEPEAPELRVRVAAQSKISPVLAAFFDNFVHDSVADFRKQLVEPTGHWRYRRVFRGSATPYIG
jgi:hypothetical protein